MKRTSLLLLLLAGCKDKEDSTTTTIADGMPTGTATGTGTGTGAATGTGTGTGTGSTSTHRCEESFWDDGLSPTAEIHVDDDGGDDTNGTGAAGSPYASMARAAQDAVPGSAIVVHEGTYAGGDSIADLRGTQGQPIWIGGAVGEARPQIVGGSESLHLTRPQWVILHDLEASASSANGINIDDGGNTTDPDAAHHVIVRNVSIHDVGGSGNEDCLKLSGLHDHLVVDSDFTRCGGGGSGSGVDHVGCHDGLILRNSFMDLSASGVQTKGGSTNIEIRANRFDNAGLRALNLGGSTGYSYFRPPLDSSADNAEARGLKVIANLFIGSESPLAFVGCTDCIAQHNTVVNPDKWMVRILQETTSDGTYSFDEVARGVLENNLFVFTRAAVSTEVNIGPSTDSNSFTWTNNLFYATDDAPSSAPTLPGTESGTVAGSDPDFTDGDYRISASSPAGGAGTPTSVVCDRDGNPYGSPPAIGAYASP